MGRKKLYKNLGEKQKAYRKRKKKAGYRQISVLVPENIYKEIAGNPTLLLEAYMKFHKAKKGGKKAWKRLLDMLGFQPQSKP